jgi:group I intron endonuclease
VSRQLTLFGADGQALPVLKTGVYRWFCTTSGKSYVGSTVRSLVHRERVHRSELRGRYHKNRYFQSAWDKHGEATFNFEVLERCPPDRCIEREQHWIDYYQAADRRFGYNLAPTAGNCAGIEQTEESNAKRAASLRGRKMSDESRAKLSAARKGMKFSEEHRANIGKSKVGFVKTPEAIERWRQSRRKSPGMKLTREKVLEIKALLAAGLSQCRIAKMAGVSQCTVSNIKLGKQWGWLKG